MSASIRILNVGSGAIGAFYSSRLATVPSVELYSICRSNYNQVKEEGFVINSNDFGEYQFIPHQVFKSIDEASNSGLVFDYCLITTKCLPDQVKMEELIQPIISKETVIVLIQNGIDIEGPYSDLFPNNPLISCIATIGVTQTAIGKISHFKGSHLSVGLFSKEANSDSIHLPNLTQFVDILEKCEVPCNITPDVEFSRWNKLMWNGSFSPICILAGGCDTMEIQESPETNQLLAATMNEIMELAFKVKGEPFPEWVPIKTAEGYIELTSGLKYKPSLLIDFERKNTLELEATLGNMLRIADKVGHPVPLTKTFYSLLKVADAKNRGLLKFNL